MKNFLKRVRSPTGSQPPLLYGFTVRCCFVFVFLMLLPFSFTHIILNRILKNMCISALLFVLVNCLFLQASILTWIRTTTACWAKRSCHVTAQRRSPPSSWTECFRSVLPMMERWFVKLAPHWGHLRLIDFLIYLIIILSFHGSRTTRPILTLSWLWKTGRNRQHFSIFLNFWTSRTKDTSMFSPSTFSSGYQWHFDLQAQLLHPRNSLHTPPLPNYVWPYFYFSLCSSGHSRADEAPWAGTCVLPGCEGALKHTKQAHSLDVFGI